MRLKLLTDVLRSAIVYESMVRVDSLSGVARLCGEGACIVRVEVDGGVAELLVVGGEVVAGRMVVGGESIVGEDVVRKVSALTPLEARVYRLGGRLYEWRDDEFTVYIRGIDLQHRQLVKTLNSLYQALVRGKLDYASEVVTFMREYSVFHFGTEERLFEKHGYPGAEKHREQHRFFVNQVERFKNMMSEAGSDTALEMLAFLADWLKNHILGSDREFGKWLRTHANTAYRSTTRT